MCFGLPAEFRAWNNSCSFGNYTATGGGGTGEDPALTVEEAEVAAVTILNHTAFSFKLFNGSHMKSGFCLQVLSACGNLQLSGSVMCKSDAFTLCIGIYEWWKPCESIAWVIFHVLHPTSDSRGLSVNCVCGPQQLAQKGRGCFWMATWCRSRIVLVKMNPLALGNERHPSVQVSMELNALIFHLIWLPFL